MQFDIETYVSEKTYKPSVFIRRSKGIYGEEYFGKEYPAENIKEIAKALMCFLSMYYPDCVLNIDKRMTDLLNALDSNKKYAKILRYIDKQPIDSEFTTQDIMSEVGFSKSQFQNARKNPIVDYLLKEFKVNDHKRITTYKKLFDIRDFDKYME